MAMHIGGAIGVTLHVVLKPRQSKAGVAWIGLAWFSPIFGSLAYLCLGINRIRRKGGALGISEARLKAVAEPPSSKEVERWEKVARQHESFRGLAKLGKEVTGRNFLVGNKVDPLVDGDEAYPAMLAEIAG